MGQTIDLHLHTTASDGTDAPLALPEKLRQAGITTFAVCDHDTIDGAMELECGADLNEGPCDCKPELDARWAALQQFLNK